MALQEPANNDAMDRVNGNAAPAPAAPIRPNDQVNNALQNVLAVIPPPHPFQVVKDGRYLNRATGRIQLRVTKEGRSGSKIKQRWVCHAEGIDGIFPTAALFVIERHGRRGYCIYDVSKDDPLNLAATLSSNPEYFAGEQDPRYAGFVQRSQSRLGGFVEYKLIRETNGTQTLQATTIMATSSLWYPVVNGYADRIVYSVIQDQNVPQDTNRPTTATDAPHSKTKKIHFESLNQPVIEHIQDDIHKIGEEHGELKILQSKRRFTNRFGRKVHRDLEPYQQKFYGRAQRASKKNLQIMEIASGKVMLQVGRLNKSDFSLDFLPPYTPFQALGLFLAQLDAN